MKRYRWTLVALAAVLVAGVVPNWAAKKKAAEAEVKLPPPAPAFTLTDQNGKKVSLADFKGKVVVLEWINWDCPFSKRQHTGGVTKTLADAYADKGVVWLGVNSTHYADVKANKKHAANHKLPYLVLDDHTGAVGRAYGAKTTPHLYVLGKDGRIAYQGAIDDNPRGKKKTGVTNYVAAALDALVAGKKIATPSTKPYGCSVKYAKLPGPEGPAAPAFALTDHNGETVSLADHKGKIVVLEWINWNCPFVKRHHRNGAMEALASKYAAKGVVWLGVNSTHSANVAANKKAADAHKTPYPVLDDHTGEVGHAYAAKTTPHLFIVAPNGVIAYRGAIDSDPRGRSSEATNYVAAALDELLAGKAVSTPETKPYGCSVKYAK